MTFVCDIDIIFNCENIAKYMPLNILGVVNISYGRHGDNMTNRSIITKKKTKKEKKKKKIFYNQVSLAVMVPSKDKKPVNMKLFTNGSIQMTGCKTIDNAIDTLITMFEELKKVKAVINYDKKEIEEKPFVSDVTKLKLSNIKNLSIAMINSNFVVPFKINRDNLYRQLFVDKYNCTYDPEVHACVNIKHEQPDKKVSIFVFERGSVIVTGAKTCTHVANAYNFINEYLLRNIELIKKRDTTDQTIVKYLEKIKTY